MRKIFFLLTAIMYVFLLTGVGYTSDIYSADDLLKLKQQPLPKLQQPEPKFEVSISPANYVKQGQTIFVKVLSDKKLLDPKMTFVNKKIKLYPVNKTEYRGIIGIDALKKAGRYKISIKDDSGILNEEKSVNVISTRFPIQNIVITGGKGGLEPAPGELAKIEAAKNALSDYSYWDQLPFNSPTNGCIISVYGLNRYYNGKPSGNYHKGVDIKAPEGNPIKAIAGGKIIIAEKLRLHGGTVAIDHGQGLTSIYLHMSKILVKPGDTVIRGQVVGKVGATGFATGPHLHWGLYINGISVNPMQNWVKFVPKC